MLSNGLNWIKRRGTLSETVWTVREGKKDLMAGGFRKPLGMAEMSNGEVSRIHYAL